MTPLKLLYELTAKGIRLIAHGEQLAADAPSGVFTEALRQAIRLHKPALLALLQPRPPRHAGGFSVTDTEHPCPVCGSPDWQQHITYRYCLHCGREDGPGAAQAEDTRSTQSTAA
jgi:TubC N-terminal docking domain